MARLNKHELSTKQLEHLFKQLSILLSSSSDKNVHSLLQQLLGPEEQIMIAKRLAVVILLEQGYSYNQIADNLHISISTASNIDNRLQTGYIRKIVDTADKDKDGYKNLVSLIESILSAGGIMPSRAGLDRYRGLRQTD